MKLFHGSNIEVKAPEIRAALRALDFGSGFYATSSVNQAERWAKAVTKRRRSGKATVTTYNFDETKMQSLKILKFEKADGQWLDFVVTNRKMAITEKQYDLIIGPIANDSTLPVIDDYMDGRYTKEEAVSRLLPQNLTDQYAFLTPSALSLLAFEEAKTL